MTQEVLSTCPSAHSNMSYASAARGSATGPCTNRPVPCTICWTLNANANRTRVWSYHYLDHMQTAQPSQQLTDADIAKWSLCPTEFERVVGKDIKASQHACSTGLQLSNLQRDKGLLEAQPFLFWSRVLQTAAPPTPQSPRSSRCRRPHAAGEEKEWCSGPGGVRGETHHCWSSSQAAQAAAAEQLRLSQGREGPACPAAEVQKAPLSRLEAAVADANTHFPGGSGCRCRARQAVLEAGSPTHQASGGGPGCCRCRGQARGWRAHLVMLNKQKYGGAMCGERVGMSRGKHTSWLRV